MLASEKDFRRPVGAPVSVAEGPMARIYDDNAASIGRTPLVRINNLTKGAKATVLA